MDLFEYEGKHLLKKFGIPVPGNSLLYDASEASPMPYPFVLKAQVLTGGRGKAGGIRVCENHNEYVSNLDSILGMSIKGIPVEAVLAEEKLNIIKEYYISITMRGTNAEPLLIISSMGGMDIEAAAHSDENAVLKIKIDPAFGIKPYQIRYIAKKLNVNEVKELSHIINSLYYTYKTLNATLVEINPLAWTDKGFLALDSKISLDEKASSRLKDIYAELVEGRARLKHFTPPVKEETTITFVNLDGNVGLISDGAGTGMMTLDLVHDEGAQVASFCELGGTTNADVMYKAMKLTLSKPDIKSVLIVLIGGFNRMDDMAEGIIRYKNEFGPQVPIYTRMCGTMEEIGKKLMTDAKLPLYNILIDAVKSAVAAAEVK